MQTRDEEKFKLSFDVACVQLYITQPCLHTLMQTRLSANQSAHTILVKFYKHMYHYMINSVKYFKIEMMAPGTVEKLFCFNVTNFHSYEMKAIILLLSQYLRSS